MRGSFDEADSGCRIVDPSYDSPVQKSGSEIPPDGHKGPQLDLANHLVRGLKPKVQKVLRHLDFEARTESYNRVHYYCTGRGMTVLEGAVCEYEERRKGLSASFRL